MSNKLILAGCGLLAPLLPSAALAQTPVTTASEAAASAADTGGLEEIVVTAQRRSEALQRTPLAVSAIPAELIVQRDITNAAQLGAIAPNVTTTQGANSSNQLIVHIRGIGDPEPVLTADAPVSVYVDGVVIGRSTGGIFDIVDLERIEVLRGPQGTLYGRNTTGGAINLITRKPSDDFGVRGLLGYGNYDALQGRVSVDTGQIGETGLKATLSYMHKQRDGYVDDLNHSDKRDPGAYNNESARIAIALDRGGPFRANYTFDWNRSKSTAPASQLTGMTADRLAYFSRSAQSGGTALIGPSTGRLDTIRSEGTFVTDKNDAHGLILEYDFSDDVMLRSISGWRRWRNDTLNTDIDGNAGLRGFVVSPGTPGVRDISLFGADKFDRQKQFSQELNLIGSVGDSIDFVLGAFYFRERANESNPQYYTFVTNVGSTAAPVFAGVNLTNLLTYATKNESKAAFGQVTYNVTSRLSLIGGLRYTKDNKSLSQTSPASLVRDLDDSWQRVNFAATIQYQATPDVMVYGRVASGYKAGGFNARAVNTGYDPENVMSYETGVKSELFDRRLRFNGTLFYTKLKDKQVNQFLANSGGAQSVTVNAGSADFKGIELEVEALPLPGLRLNGTFGYTDRNYKSFFVVDPATNLTVDVADEAQFNYAASTTYNIGAQYEIGAMLGGQLSARLDWTYRSKIFFNSVPTFAPFDDQIRSPGFGLLDGRLTLGELAIGGSEAALSLWGRNLTNKTYRVSGIDFGSLGFATNTYGLPRTYGVDLRFAF